MKTKIILTADQLINTEFRQMNITIRLDDECKNGHEDFAITGDAWYKNERSREASIGGCIHEEILKIRPDLKLFVDLHLSDFSGAPMYAIENGIYHFPNKETAKQYLRITDDEYIKLLIATSDKLYFSYLLETMGIVNRWNEEAKEATKKLEEMTGEVFASKATRRQYTPLTIDQFNDIEEKIKNGYYTPEAIILRNDQKKKAKQEEKNTKKLQYLQEAIDLASNEYNGFKWLIDHGIDFDNCIYYKHTDQFSFGWRTPLSNEQKTELAGVLFNFPYTWEFSKNK